MHHTKILQTTSIDEVKQMLKKSLRIQTESTYNYGYGGEGVYGTSIKLILDDEVISEVDI